MAFVGCLVWLVWPADELASYSQEFVSKTYQLHFPRIRPKRYLDMAWPYREAMGTPSDRELLKTQVWWGGD